MSLEAAVFSILTANAGVAALVGTRVYPVLLPQVKEGETPQTPAIVYTRTGGIREALFTAPPLLVGVGIQVDCWSSSYATVKDLAQAVHRALDGFRGLSAGEEIQGAFLETEFGDTFEAEVKLFRVTEQYRLWHREAAA